MSNLFVATLTVEELRNIIGEVVQKTFTENSPKPPDKYITPTETCSLLGISRPTLTSYTSQGKLKDYRIGRKVLYKQAEVDAALITLKKYQPIQAA